MEQRPFGNTGFSVSALGFGCGNVGGLMVRGSFDDQVAAVRRAMDAGVTYFDTAALYGNGRSEQNLGRVLKYIGAWGEVRVGTKLRLTPEELADPAGAVRGSLIASLERLDHDSVDLIQLHNQLGGAGPTAIPADQVERVAEAMHGLVREGLARHVGCTGLGETETLRRTIDGRRFESVQAYFNALNPSYGFAGATGGSQDFGGLIDAAAAQRMGVIAIRVMAGGAMVGSTERAALASPTPGDLVPGSEFVRDAERALRLGTIAIELGLESALELSFRFALAKPGVSTVLVGYSDIDQLEDSIRWAERGPLSDEGVRLVVELARH